MTPSSAILRAIICEIAAVDFYSADSPKVAESPIDRILKKILILDLPGKEHFESYIRHKSRNEPQASTLKGSFNAVVPFSFSMPTWGRAICKM